MKKNLVLVAILMAYAVTFILLFIKLRSMSANVLEELSENNVYYMLGFMFIAGIAASLYLIMDASNKKLSLSGDGGSEFITFNNVQQNDSKHNKEQSSNLEGLKNELSVILQQPGSSLADRLEKAVWKLNSRFEISQALVYTKDKGSGELMLQVAYAYILQENDSRAIISGEGLTGQAVKDGTAYFIKDIPAGYLKVISGLGESLPKSLLIIPCKVGSEVKTVFELSSLQEYSKQTFDDIVHITHYISEQINQ
jgi:hypothetical protein